MRAVESRMSYSFPFRERLRAVSVVFQRDLVGFIWTRARYEKFLRRWHFIFGCRSRIAVSFPRLSLMELQELELSEEKEERRSVRCDGASLTNPEWSEQ